MAVARQGAIWQVKVVVGNKTDSCSTVGHVPGRSVVLGPWNVPWKFFRKMLRRSGCGSSGCSSCSSGSSSSSGGFRGLEVEEVQVVKSFDVEAAGSKVQEPARAPLCGVALGVHVSNND